MEPRSTPLPFGLVLLIACACGGGEERAAPAPTIEATEPPIPEPAPQEAPADPWTELLALDPGGRDLAIRSFPLVEGPPLVRYSDLAMRMCHADDPVGRLLALGADAELTRDVARTRMGLRCGRVIAEHLPAGARVHVVELDRERYDRPLHVIAIATTLTDPDALAEVLPEHRPESRGPHRLHCQPFDVDGRSCAERDDTYDHAVAVVGGYVIAGAYVTLAALLEWPRVGSVLALLDDIGSRVGDADIELDFPAPGGRWMIGPRRWLPFTIDGSSDALSTAVRIHARAVGWDRGLTSGLIVIEPRCESDACAAREALADALRAYHDAWKPTARARMEELFADADPEDVSDACMREQETARVEAIERASIESAGAIRLRFPTAEPRAECERAERERVERAAAQVQQVLGAP